MWFTAQLHRMTTAFWKVHTQTLVLSARISIFFETYKLTVPSCDWRKKSVSVFKVQHEIPLLRQELSGKIFSCSLKNCKILEMFHGQSINTLKIFTEQKSDFLSSVLCSWKFHSRTLKTFCSYLKHLNFLSWRYYWKHRNEKLMPSRKTSSFLFWKWS